METRHETEICYRIVQPFLRSSKDKLQNGQQWSFQKSWKAVVIFGNSLLCDKFIYYLANLLNRIVEINIMNRVAESR